MRGVVSHAIAAFGVMGIAFWFGTLLFPMGDTLPIVPRLLLHVAGFLVTFPLHWIWLRTVERSPDSALAAALGGPTLRFIGFFVLVAALYAGDRELVWPGAVLYSITIGTFLCFQVVTQARRKYPGLGP